VDEDAAEDDDEAMPGMEAAKKALIADELNRALPNAPRLVEQAELELRQQEIDRLGTDEDAAEDDDEAMPGMEAAKKALIEGLGKERRDRVLAAIHWRMGERSAWWTKGTYCDRNTH
jgi:hypothetical protein